MSSIVKAYAAQSAESGLAPTDIERRSLRPDDVGIQILYCGVCHTDIHYAQNDWGNTRYPLVPGHEIIGRVTAVGEAVSAYHEGDLVGVGCMVDSCRHCAPCEGGLEQYCDEGMTLTYNGLDRLDGSVTRGGYSQAIVVSERFVLRVPEIMDLASAAPLLCAGITTWSPLRHYGVGQGHRLGVIGMGGLGHLGVKFAKALGAHVTLFTRSEEKFAEARRQGADEVVLSTDAAQMERMAGQLDFVLDTIPVPHDLTPYLNTLKMDGTHILVGLLEALEPAPMGAALIRKRRKLGGSLIGGIAETQEMLDFCAEQGISCDVEMLAMGDINEAYQRMQRGDVKYRFVIDLKTLA